LNVAYSTASITSLILISDQSSLKLADKQNPHQVSPISLPTNTMNSCLTLPPRPPPSTTPQTFSQPILIPQSLVLGSEAPGLARSEGSSVSSGRSRSGSLDLFNAVIGDATPAPAIDLTPLTTTTTTTTSSKSTKPTTRNRGYRRPRSYSAPAATLSKYLAPLAPTTSSKTSAPASLPKRNPAQPPFPLLLHSLIPIFQSKNQP